MTHNADQPPRTSRALTARYQRAFALCSQRHPDLLTARRLLLQCVLEDPGNLIFVETFLQVLRRVRPARFWWRGLWRRLAFAQAARAAAWPRLVQLGLPLIVLRPTDSFVLCGLGEACMQLGHSDVALRYWMLASSTRPNDVTIQRRCAQSLSRLGLFDQAQRCWERVLELAPDDRSARQACRIDIGVSPTSAADSPALLPGELDPSDADAVLSHAETLRTQNQTQAAVQLLRRAAQACPGDVRLREKLEDLDLELARHRLEQGCCRADADSSPEAQQLVDDLQADLVRREIEVYGARCRRYPADHVWKLRLARRLKQVGNFAEACHTLEDIPDDFPGQCEAAVELGECRQYQRQFATALACYEKAARVVSASPPFDAIEQQALYRAGVLALQLNEVGKADGYLRRLALGHPDYKDLPRHLDKIDLIRHKDGFSNDFLPPQQVDPGSEDDSANRDVNP